MNAGKILGSQVIGEKYRLGSRNGIKICIQTFVAILQNEG